MARNPLSALAALRDRRRERRRERRGYEEESIPEGMNHVGHTLALARARQRYEEQAGREFDDLVARESGTFGWETFNLCILVAGSAGCAVLGAVNGMVGPALVLGALGALCLTLILLRWWYAVRSRPGRDREPDREPDRASDDWNGRGGRGGGGAVVARPGLLERLRRIGRSRRTRPGRGERRSDRTRGSDGPFT
ncbi:hypothetical protein HUT18_21505 [Streptomyces sp. NA04227]|uniref:hypothetical protein n=1 Tax=Streptomyces sp. NA04227 TaxID=2742136 RepID=UPI00158FF851|nr:hypothetical protein [Streptomyces sp. NA04227]QKW08558.1 hypothetical protein HUT18_21505 [Streptomyces sp. NA04227]